MLSFTPKPRLLLMAATTIRHRHRSPTHCPWLPRIWPPSVHEPSRAGLLLAVFHFLVSTDSLLLYHFWYPSAFAKPRQSSSNPKKKKNVTSFVAKKRKNFGVYINPCGFTEVTRYFSSPFPRTSPPAVSLVRLFPVFLRSWREKGEWTLGGVWP